MDCAADDDDDDGDAAVATVEVAAAVYLDLAVISDSNEIVLDVELMFVDAAEAAVKGLE